MTEPTRTLPLQGTGRATSFGVAVGTAPFWIVYSVVVAILCLPPTDGGDSSDGLLIFWLLAVGGGGAAAIVLVVGLVFSIAERTRQFGAGMALGGGIGILVGGLIWAFAVA